MQLYHGYFIQSKLPHHYGQHFAYAQNQADIK